MSAPKYVKPTEGELEILRVIWEKGLASVREVHEELAKTKDVGYTTTLKLMQIMNDKGLVKRDKSTRAHYYTAAVSKEKTQKHLVGRMIDGLFGGSPGQLVIQALGNYKASEEEIEEIQKLLNHLKIISMSFSAAFPFLNALGWALLHSLWQFAVCWLIWRTLTDSLKKLTAAIKHTLALLLLLAGTLSFVAGLSWKYYAASGSVNNSVPVVTNTWYYTTWHTAGNTMDAIMPYWSLLYLICVLFLL